MWDKGVWLSRGEAVALTRVWNASTSPPGGKDWWEASWGGRRAKGSDVASVGALDSARFDSMALNGSTAKVRAGCPTIT